MESKEWRKSSKSFTTQSTLFFSIFPVLKSSLYSRKISGIAILNLLWYARNMDAILVTGGAGYIGAQVCKTLARAGYLPIAYDNLSTGHAYAVKWGPFVHADLCDRDKLHETFQKF